MACRDGKPFFLFRQYNGETACLSKCLLLTFSKIYYLRQKKGGRHDTPGHRQSHTQNGNNNGMRRHAVQDNFFCLALLLLLLAAPARAATYTVTDPGNSGPNTLRGLITGAALNGDTIVFSPLVDTVSLVPANGEIGIGATGLTIQGNPASWTIIDGGGTRTSPIFLNTNNQGSGLNITNLHFKNVDYSSDYTT